MNVNQIFWTLILILTISIFVLGFSIGKDYGEYSERKAILERLEEVDSIHRQDSIRQQSYEAENIVNWQEPQ